MCHQFIWDVCVLGVCVCLEGLGGYWDSSLITTLIMFLHRPLKLPPLHQVSVWLPGNQGSGVPERRCLFPANDLREDGRRWGCAGKTQIGKWKMLPQGAPNQCLSKQALSVSFCWLPSFPSPNVSPAYHAAFFSEALLLQCFVSLIFPYINLGLCFPQKYGFCMNNWISLNNFHYHTLINYSKKI